MKPRSAGHLYVRVFMSHEFPVFTYCADRSTITSANLSLTEALDILPAEYWCSISRNWWYQGLITEILNAYSGFETLRYLTEIVSVVEPHQLDEKSKAIFELIKTIGEQTETFVRLSCCNAASSIDEVRENVEAIRTNIKEAKVLRDFDDDSRYAYGNFFSFLVSQAAALDEAPRTERCLVYVRPQP